MYLIVVVDESGKWHSEPEIFSTLREAHDAVERKADGTVPELSVALYTFDRRTCATITVAGCAPATVSCWWADGRLSNMERRMHDPLIADLLREHARDLAQAGERIAELEAALRDLLAHDDARFGYEGEPSEVERRCRAVLEDKQPKLI